MSVFRELQLRSRRFHAGVLDAAFLSIEGARDGGLVEVLECVEQEDWRWAGESELDGFKRV